MSKYPHIPAYGIMDFDPDGVAILSTYKHGSYSLAHENASTGDSAPSRRLNLPQLGWLGVKSCHLNQSASLERSGNENATCEISGVMKLTVRDRHKARRMLDWEICNEDGPEPEWRRELQVMLMLNVKAEMQIFEEQTGGLAFWLGNEFQQK